MSSVSSTAENEAGTLEVDGPSGTEADAGLPPTDVESACARYATAYCHEVAACDALYFGTSYGSEQACEARIAPGCSNEVSAPGTGLTASALHACSDALASRDCASAYTTTVPACAWHGSLGDGTGCEYGSQCRSGFCSRTNGQLCGVCAAAVLLEAGAACDPGAAECPDGFTCANAICDPPAADGGACRGTKWICTRPVPDGGACVSTQQCFQAELECVKGVCQPAEAGSICEDSCPIGESLDCLTVNGSNACLTARYVDAGQHCDVNGAALCAAGGRCVDGDGRVAAIGQCRPALGNGQPCDGGVDCLAPAICLGGTCTPFVPASQCPELGK